MTGVKFTCHRCILIADDITCCVEIMFTNRVSSTSHSRGTISPSQCKEISQVLIIAPTHLPGDDRSQFPRKQTIKPEGIFRGSSQDLVSVCLIDLITIRSPNRFPGKSYL